MDATTARKTWRVLFNNHEFAWFISTRFILIFSLFMQTTVLSYLLYTLTHDPLSLGMLGLAEVIPAFACAFIAGYIVDKHIKRNVYLLCIVLYVVIAILAWVAVFTNQHQLLNIKYTTKFIYLIMFLNGVVRAFLAPASFSLLPLLIPKSDIPQAITWSSTSWMLGSVLGSLAGGLLMSVIGIQHSITCVLVLLIIAIFPILKIKPQPLFVQVKENLWNGLKQGFHFVFRTEIILAVLSLDLFAVLFGGAEALLPVYAHDILHVGEIGFGWLRSAHGMGAIILLFVLAYLPLKTNVGMKLLLSVAMFGMCMIMFGLSTNVYVSFICLLLAGMFDGVSVVIRHSILQLHTPEEVKGRVASINTLFISSSNELGAFESGVAAKYLGTVSAVVFGGCMTLLVVLLTYKKAPSLKQIKIQ